MSSKSIKRQVNIYGFISGKEGEGNQFRKISNIPKPYEKITNNRDKFKHNIDMPDTKVTDYSPRKSPKNHQHSPKIGGQNDRLIPKRRVGHPEIRHYVYQRSSATSRKKRIYTRKGIPTKN